MSNAKRFVFLGIVGVLAAVGGVLVAGTWLQPPRSEVPTQVATVLPGGRDIAAFALTDHHGQAFDNARLQGRWSLLFFGYTYCPDVCPNTLWILGEAAQRIVQSEGEAAAPQVVLVSVDPERDSPQRLAEYVPYFNADFLGVTGEHTELEKLTRDLGLLYVSRKNESEGDGYLVDHSSAILLINPAGRLQAVFQMPHRPAAIADDFLSIRNRYRE